MMSMFQINLRWFQLVCLLLLTVAVNGQRIAHLNANNLSVGFGTGGNLFSCTDSATTPIFSDTGLYGLFRPVKDKNIKTVYTASFMLGALDEDSVLHLSQQRFVESTREWYNGPVSSSYDSLYKTYFDRVFKITRGAIDSFIQMGVIVGAINIPESIRYWPAKGNQQVYQKFEVSINENLAPFVDKNGDGIYNPLKGEYPALCGEEGVFLVFNDFAYGQPILDDTIPDIGVEVRCYAQVFKTPLNGNAKSAVDNCVLVNYEVQNKSSHHYSKVYGGIWQDPDLGCFNNDRVGCSPALNLMYTYNGVQEDNACMGVEGTFPFKASYGTMFLNNKLEGFVVPWGFIAEKSYYELLQGLTPSGTKQEIYTASGDTIYTTFCFPDSMLEANIAFLPPGDRRKLGSTSIGNFAPGETKSIDLAIFVSYDSTATHISIVDTLKRDAGIIQQFYDNVVLPCRAQSITGTSENELVLQAQVYPNPTRGSISIRCNELLQKVVLYNVHAQELFSMDVNTHEATIYLPKLPKGIYVLHLNSATSTTAKKIMVE